MFNVFISRNSQISQNFCFKFSSSEFFSQFFSHCRLLELKELSCFSEINLNISESLVKMYSFYLYIYYGPNKPLFRFIPSLHLNAATSDSSIRSEVIHFTKCDLFTVRLGGAAGSWGRNLPTGLWALGSGSLYGLCLPVRFLDELRTWPSVRKQKGKWSLWWDGRRVSSPAE